jgi:AAA15 family ATPase/GTPase
MIKSIHIQNFRCFEEFQLEGFGRVNLIGGMNNAGKTALLEGILLGADQDPETIVAVKELRYSIDCYHESESKDTYWDDFFYNREKSREIDIAITAKNDNVLRVNYKTLPKRFMSESNMLCTLYANQQRFYSGEIKLARNNESFFTEKEYNESLDLGKFDVRIITTIPPSNFRENIVSNYSRIELEGGEDYFLKAFQLIDKSIIGVKIVVLGEPNLYLRKEGTGFMPIDLFGDAILKVARYINGFIETPNNILLIDEIENGIHYANQPKVWETIFKLAEEFNVQIFATTHSKEMATAFAEAAEKSGKKEEAKYIEMARHYKTNKIVGLVHDVDLLQYKLDRNEPFRGE